MSTRRIPFGRVDRIWKQAGRTSSPLLKPVEEIEVVLKLTENIKWYERLLSFDSDKEEFIIQTIPPEPTKIRRLKDWMISKLEK